VADGEMSASAQQNVWIGTARGWRCVAHNERSCKICVEVVRPPAWPREGQYVRSDGSRVSVDEGQWWSGLRKATVVGVALLHGDEMLRGEGVLSIDRDEESVDLGLSFSRKKTTVFVPFREVTFLEMVEAPLHLRPAKAMPSSYRSGYASSAITGALFGVPPVVTVVGKAVRRHNQKQRELLTQGKTPPVILKVGAGDHSWTFYAKDPERLITKFGLMIQAWIDTHPVESVTADGPLTPPSSVADELAKLAALRDQGILTPEEFERQKAKLLS